MSDETRTPADGALPAQPGQRQAAGEGHGVPATREAPEARPEDGARPDETSREPAGEVPATSAEDSPDADGAKASPDAGKRPDAAVESPADDEATEEPVDHSPAASAPEQAADGAAARVAEPEAEPGVVPVAGDESETREAGADDVRDQPSPLLPGDPEPGELPSRAVARGRLGSAMRPRATRAQLLAGLLCALLGFALVVQARQTQAQGLDQLRQADLVTLLDNVTNAEARAEQDVRDETAIRDRLLSGTDSSAAAQQAARRRLETLGILAGTVPASGPGIELDISDPRRQVDSSVLLDALEELRDGGAEVVQIGSVRVVAATAFTDDADGIRVDDTLMMPPYRFKVIGDPQTLSRLLQIPGGVLDVLKSKGAQGTVTQPSVVRIDALRPASTPQYARPAQGSS